MSADSPSDRSPAVAVLLTHHGTVSDLNDVPGFLANIRRGQPVPPKLVAEVRHRLEHIGGSPLMRISLEQASLLEARLAASPSAGVRAPVRVRVAARLWHPYPSEVLAELRDDGVETVVSLPLAPQSVHVYHASVCQAAASHGLGVVEVPPWGEEPALVAAMADTVREGLAALPLELWPHTAVVLSAHSLPSRVIAAGDPYEIDFRRMAARVAAELDLQVAPNVGIAEAAAGVAELPTDARLAFVAFQSQGATSDEWLGPDLPATFARIARVGLRAVVLSPIGFLAEHVETLYDLDVDAPRIAAAAGIERYVRAPAVGTRRGVIDALEVVARRAIQRMGFGGAS